MKNLLFLLLLLIVLPSLHAQYNYTNLRVGDPRNSWWTDQGSIDEAVISIKPKGLYLEYGLYLTFSANNTNYGANDTLEVVLDFGLPEGAMVTDSWLWLYDDIIKGKLIDRWSASQIYEDIVDRRQDPSILTKNSPTQYQLRVFPMAGNQTRKVKITYLLPLSLTREKATAYIPWEVLTVSKTPVYDFDVLLFDHTMLDEPRIEYKNPKEFTFLENEELGEYLFARLPVDPSLQLVFDSPFKDGLFLGTYEVDEENGFYQIGILPDAYLDRTNYHKLAILVDNELFNCSENYSHSVIFKALKDHLSEKLTEKDSFNLFVSGLQIKSFSDSWMPATQGNIAGACAFGEEEIATYSNLLPLLQTGIEFVNENEAWDDAELVLISNAGQYTDYTSANTLLDDLMDLMEEEFPIHIMNYQNFNMDCNWIGNNYYCGNQYLYINLAHLTQGLHFSLEYNQPVSVFEERLGEIFNGVNGQIDYFSLDVRTEEGYTFGVFDMVETNRHYLDAPVVQMGRYHGQSPFKVEMNGALDDEFFNYQINVDEAEIVSLDTVANQIWGGFHLSDLESISYHSNSVINDIINASLDYRVLSNYTAFLCLEDTAQYCASCIDETELVDTEELINDPDSLVNVYPNPFRDVLNVELSVRENLEEDKIMVSIHDFTGKTIKVLSSGTSAITDKYLYTWKPGVEISAGVYFVRIVSANRTFVQKVIKWE